MHLFRESPRKGVSQRREGSGTGQLSPGSSQAAGRRGLESLRIPTSAI